MKPDEALSRRIRRPAAEPLPEGAAPTRSASQRTTGHEKERLSTAELLLYS
jgi:hypothetical protein